MAYAPSAIRAAATAITGGIGGAVFSGVVGDAAHSYGYHLARNQLPGSDYSVQLAADRDGNGDAASALDISLPPAEMIAVTARLRAAAKAGDPRLFALREFAGTLDGRTTFNRDLSNGGEGFGNWDDSHLWHIHLSGYRRYADDPDAWRAIADVFTDSADLSGALKPAPTPEEDDMYDDTAKQLAESNANKLDTLLFFAQENRLFKLYNVADTSTDGRAGEVHLVALGFDREIGDVNEVPWWQKWKVAGAVISIASGAELDGIIAAHVAAGTPADMKPILDAISRIQIPAGKPLTAGEIVDEVAQRLGKAA